MDQLAQNAPAGETVKEALMHFVPRLTDADATVLAVLFTQEGASNRREILEIVRFQRGCTVMNRGLARHPPIPIISLVRLQQFVEGANLCV